MKTRILSILFLAGFAAQLLAAQNAPKPVTAPAPSNFISDDDGGVVQIVPVNAPAPGPRKAHYAPVMKSVQQVSIFLGSDWADNQVRAREGALADLSAKLGELENHKTSLLPPASSVENFADLSQHPVNDLVIQQKLVEMLQSKQIPAPDSSIVYVIFLAPGIKSSVGAHTGGVDYAAYHNLLHAEEGQVRYVVVPFSDNVDRAASAASRAVVETAFNPTSD